jgi:phage shock protein PspC (stress-responsive transcriptional regulator)
MYCTHCGTELHATDRFCAQCGKPAQAASAYEPPANRPPFARFIAQQKIGGVCAGLARYLNLDVTLVRVLFVLGAFAWFSTVLAYLVLWAVMSRDDRPPFTAGVTPSVPRAA